MLYCCAVNNKEKWIWRPHWDKHKLWSTFSDYCYLTMGHLNKKLFYLSSIGGKPHPGILLDIITLCVPEVLLNLLVITYISQDDLTWFIAASWIDIMYSAVGYMFRKRVWVLLSFWSIDASDGGKILVWLFWFFWQIFLFVCDVVLSAICESSVQRSTCSLSWSLPIVFQVSTGEFFLHMTAKDISQPKWR